MPKVGGKHFAYSSKGKKAAKAYAKESGQSVEKYYGGGSVDPFSTRNPKGVPAEQIAEAMENQNMANKGIPTTDAPDRIQTSLDTTEYNEGGKVKESAQLESAKARYESAKKGKYYDVESGKVKKWGRTKEGYKDPKWLKGEETTYNLVKLAKKEGKKK